VQLGQTALDPRNAPAKVARSLTLTGIFNCVSCYKCEEVCPAHIPIVSEVIEPLKAKTAQLVPEMAKHAFALRDVVAERGRVDPGALVLRVRGWRALSNISRLFRLLLRGKINPLKTILTIATPAAPAAARILTRDSTK
jgi:heterodisulfide reductase subunit C